MPSPSYPLGTLAAGGSRRWLWRSLLLLLSAGHSLKGAHGSSSLLRITIGASQLLLARHSLQCAHGTCSLLLHCLLDTWLSDNGSLI